MARSQKTILGSQSFSVSEENKPMASWRKLSTPILTRKAEDAEERGEWARAEEIWEELEQRDAEADANRGVMNGIAPSR
jgi:hypothetical protein